MHDVVEDFIEHLKRSKFASVADQLEAALRATDAEADGNPDAAAMFEAIIWICRHDRRTIAERIRALDRLISHDGTLIEMKRFTGWLES